MSSVIVLPSGGSVCYVVWCSAVCSEQVTCKEHSNNNVVRHSQQGCASRSIVCWVTVLLGVTL